MRRRETVNHNEKYVLYYEFEDADRLEGIEEPPAARRATPSGV